MMIASSLFLFCHWQHRHEPTAKSSEELQSAEEVRQRMLKLFPNKQAKISGEFCSVDGDW